MTHCGQALRGDKDRRRAVKAMKRVLRLVCFDSVDYAMACFVLAVAQLQEDGTEGADVVKGRRLFLLGHEAAKRNRYLFGSDTSFPLSDTDAPGDPMPPIVDHAYQRYAKGNRETAEIDLESLYQLLQRQRSGAVKAAKQAVKAGYESMGINARKLDRRPRNLCTMCGVGDDQSPKGKLLQCSGCHQVSCTLRGRAWTC